MGEEREKREMREMREMREPMGCQEARGKEEPAVRVHVVQSYPFTCSTSEAIVNQIYIYTYHVLCTVRYLVAKDDARRVRVRGGFTRVVRVDR